MGLDMYLSRRISLFGRDCNVSVKGTDIIFGESDSLSIKQEIGYWRKANAIHGWMVRNVQNGVDDNTGFELTPEKALQLLSLCNQVLDEPSRAHELLPTQSGFLFGNNEYNDLYIKHIRDTVLILTDALRTNKQLVNDYSLLGIHFHISLIYQSNW